MTQNYLNGLHFAEDDELMNAVLAILSMSQEDALLDDECKQQCIDLVATLPKQEDIVNFLFKYLLKDTLQYTSCNYTYTLL